MPARTPEEAASPADSGVSSAGANPAPGRREAARVLTTYTWCLGAIFVASIPLSFIFGREIGAVRNWQIWLNAALLLLLVSKKDVATVTRGPVPRAAWRFLLAAAALSYLVCSLSRFYGFLVNGVDFSIFDWMLESTLRGRFMYSPIYDLDHLGVHQTYLMFLLLPLHALFRTPALLCVVNALLIWSGVFPCARLARRFMGYDAWGLLAGAFYLTNPWVTRMVNGGFRPESAYPVLGLMFAVGWTERRRWLWVLGAAGFLCIKEDAGFYLAALAVGSLLHERTRRRESLALLLCAVAVPLFDITVVQRLLRGSGSSQPGYLVFWGAWGSTLPQILASMALHPARLVADIATSSWLLMLGPLLLLPLLAPLPRSAMMPALLLLGSSTNPNMRLYQSYYPVPLVPFVLWGLVASYEVLVRVRLREPLFVVVLLVGPLLIDGYVKFDRPRFDLTSEMARVEAVVRAGTGPLCVQTVLFPHVLYEDSPLPLLGSCEKRRGARLLLSTQLDPWPRTKEEIAALASGGEGRRVVPFGAGLVLVEPVERQSPAAGLQ